jgi:hypothetical protein
MYIEHIYATEVSLSPRKLYSFYITDTQKAGLKAIKQAADLTESDQIRQALDAWLRKWKRKGVTAEAERRPVVAGKRS